MPIDPIITAALISGSITLLGLLLGWVLNRRINLARSSMSESNAVQRLSDTAISLVTPLNKRISELESLTSDQGIRLTAQSLHIAAMDTRLLELQNELVGVRAGAQVLITQLETLGVVPQYKLPVR